jgi:hypothetical protein
MSEDTPYVLLRWIKRDQEEKIQHTEKMANKYYEESKQFIALIVKLADNWGKLKPKEKLFLQSVMRTYDSHLNLSPAQKSQIAHIYYSKVS